MRVSVVTVSDRSFRGEREDLSGPALRDYLRERGVEVEAMEVVPDEEEDIVRVL
ncbi:MAG: molybdenum cofactor biosynthesis protein, partial [Deltaproteobacteria bacterium]